MKVIIIAAGMGNRLLHHTQDTPKCMLKVQGKPLIEYQLEIYEKLGINNISIIKGFQKEKINYEGTKTYYNDNYTNNNILASLFYAEKELDDDVIVSYSDIVFKKKIIDQLLSSPGDISIVVDIDWNNLTPVEEAEKVVMAGGKIKQIGKHLTLSETNGGFIGVAKFTRKGAKILRETYNDVLEKYKDKPFHKAPSLEKAYLTDIFQELINRGHKINAAPIRGGWVEIDTPEDLKRAGGEVAAGKGKITPEVRRGLLKKIFLEKGFARVMEAHNGISAITASNAVYSNKTIFDALWISSLTESASKGQPDIEILGLDSRLDSVRQILEVTNKPVIIDGDTGGDPNAFEYFIRRAENLGASAVVIEDKIYPKRNSLDLESVHVQEKPEIFANKIIRGKKALLTDEFMIIARIESFIAKKGLDDAIDRTKVYLEAGVDGILIHSNSKMPDEVISFAGKYKELSHAMGLDKPLICVPTTYNSVKESELRKAGFKMVIHANHALRASIKAMQNVYRVILENERSLEAEQFCSSVGEIFDLVGFSDIKNKDSSKVPLFIQGDDFE